MPQPHASATLIRHFAEAQSFTARGAPGAARKADVSVELKTGGVEGQPELRLRLKIEAAGQYAVDIIYCGVFALEGVSPDALPRLLMIDAPALLFPFARQLAADAVRGAGFGMLSLEMVDFAKLHEGRNGSAPKPADVRFIAPPGQVRPLFPSHLYHAPLGTDLALERACLDLAARDAAGREWAKANAYRGYTSYASVRDLTARDPAFAELVALLDGHVAAFAEAAEFDMRGKRLVLDTIWANVMEEGGMHTSHIHPHSAISGTYYVTTPDGAAAICFEDPRSGLMMSAPARTPGARPENRAFVQVRPQAGSLLLWESWLRHGVEMQHGDAPRISISFNYRIETT
jgi:uncharacterized protein (TIGR02466 family)